MAIKFFYRFDQGEKLVFMCTARDSLDAMRYFENYKRDVESGRCEEMVFDINKRCAGETQEEYLARMKSTRGIVGNGVNREMKRKSNKLIRNKLRFFNTQKRKEAICPKNKADQQ